MNKRKLRTLLCMFLAVGVFSSAGFAQAFDERRSSQIALESIAPAMRGVDEWFSAWEFVSGEIYGINSLKRVEFVFFDSKNVYSTSMISVPDGSIVDGPKLFGKKLIWRQGLHKGEITLPDGRLVQIGLMSFASSLKGKNKQAFFVMPLPEFWEEAGAKSEELGIKKLLTGVFLHEFSHSQQMTTFGKRISDYEQKYKFDPGLSDDIIQDYFEKDTVYETSFREEVELFYKAADVDEKSQLHDLTGQALDKLKARQKNYFTADKMHFAELDDLFLTMEGFGQMTMYLWLTDPKGGNVEPETAIKGVRRGKRSWSQDEGLALFLLLNKFTGPRNWSKRMLGKRVETVVELLEIWIKR